MQHIARSNLASSIQSALAGQDKDAEIRATVKSFIRTINEVISVYREARFDSKREVESPYAKVIELLGALPYDKLKEISDLKEKVQDLNADNVQEFIESPTLICPR